MQRSCTCTWCTPGCAAAIATTGHQCHRHPRRGDTGLSLLCAAMGTWCGTSPCPLCGDIPPEQLHPIPAVTEERLGAAGSGEHGAGTRQLRTGPQPRHRPHDTGQPRGPGMPQTPPWLPERLPLQAGVSPGWRFAGWRSGTGCPQ